MDAEWLARLQFAVTVGIHFLFPPLSIGLAWLLVLVEGLAWRRGDPVWESAGRFFGKVLALTFGVGVATGIVMEFQFGTNWSRYSTFVGDIFGAPLAAEGVFAFFLESSFLGLYLFGRGRVSRGLHWFSILMVAVGSTLSAFWILVANSWQQTPAGYEIQEGRAVLTSFADAVLNPSMWVRFFHTMDAALIAGAFAIAGIAALWKVRGQGGEVAGRSLRLGIAAGLFFAVLAVFPTGHEHARQVARTQPEKFAAIEGLYATQSGAPLVLFALPHREPPTLKAKVEIPSLTSWMAFGDPGAEIQGIDRFPPDQIPPLWMTFVSFHNMVVLGMWFIGLTALGALLWWRGLLERTRWYLWLLVGSAPLPLVACQFGWVTAEVGRQPWAVYRLLRTADAYSITVGAPELLFSIALLGGIGLLLIALYLYLLNRQVRQGPEAVREVA